MWNYQEVFCDISTRVSAKRPLDLEVVIRVSREREIQRLVDAVALLWFELVQVAGSDSRVVI